MATTSLGFRYPASTDAPRVWQDIQNLASDVDTVVAPLVAPAYFFGSLLTSTALTSGTAINLTTIVEDTVNGWDATNHKYVFKRAGLYVVQGALKANASGGGPTPLFVKNGSSYVSGPNGSTGAFGGMATSFVGRFAVNDNMFMATASAGMTTQSDSPAHNCYMTITQIG